MAKRKAPSARPAQPAVTGMAANYRQIQSPQPGPQQRRRLDPHREHPPRTADEGVDPQPGGPGAQLIGAEGRQAGAAAPRPVVAGRASRSNGSEWVRLSPPRPASSNLRPGDGMASKSATRAPAAAAASAAIRPAGPAPTMVTECSCIGEVYSGVGPAHQSRHIARKASSRSATWAAGFIRVEDFIAGRRVRR